jgi:hypothetical protein
MYLDGLKLASFFTCLLFGLAVIVWWHQTINVFGNPWASLVLFVLAIEVGIQWIAKPHRQDEFGYFSSVRLISVAMILVKSPSLRQASDALRLFVWVLMILAVLGTVMYVFLPDFAGSVHLIRGPVQWIWPDLMRARGLMNTVGGLGLAGGIIAVYGLTCSGWRSLIFLAVGIPTVILSDTRGAVFAIAIAFMAIAVAQTLRRRWLASLKPMIVSVISGFYMLAYSGENSFIYGLTARFQLWNNYFETPRLPLPGVASEAGATSEAVVTSEVGRVHNFVLQAAADAGYIAIFITFLLLLMIGVAVFRAIRDSNFTPAVLLIFVVIFSTTDYGLDLTRWSIGTTVVVLALFAIDLPGGSVVRRVLSRKDSRTTSGE